MKFVFGKQDMAALEQAQSRCWLLTNGLGGYMSLTAGFGVTRCDHAFLMSAVTAPAQRAAMVHRLSERLTVNGRSCFLSTQTFADRRPPEDGYKNLSSFVWDGGPSWVYQVSGVQVRRQCAMEYGGNTAAVLYTIENRTMEPCTLEIRPFCLFAPKGRRTDTAPSWHNGALHGNGYTVTVSTNGTLVPGPAEWEELSYPDDARDGRVPSGPSAACCRIIRTVRPGEGVQTLEIVFSQSGSGKSANWLLMDQAQWKKHLTDWANLRTPAARQLVQSADAFVARRDSTGGTTIVAGYPFFGDWGRDTMIALPGCLLTAGRYGEAKSVLRTFLAYEKDGLVPNLFPETGGQPWYNTADAALLLINCVWLYYQRTGDSAFIPEAWPVMKRIIDAYTRGTRFATGMDADGLIRAGEGLDQVTWMDVRVDGFLPTPRHGKPVEINAYWYNALCVMQELAPLMGETGAEYAAQSRQTKTAFLQKFWMEDAGYLKDVISGTRADEQLRCNQIWAVSMPFTMLSHEQECRIVDAVYRDLYTPCGLRTLAPWDPEFHPVYAGTQAERDMAYHQGTVWPFPLGAYYLAYLKTHGGTREAARTVREQLEPVESMLREGCIGFLPEVYDGGTPGMSKGCFAQAWSVGELLRVYEKLEEIERGGVEC